MSLERPNYYNSGDRMLYEQLLNIQREGFCLNEQEQKFCNYMYHQEEHACGLDGEE